jgi:hypothetical protein
LTWRRAVDINRMLLEGQIVAVVVGDHGVWVDPGAGVASSDPPRQVVPVSGEAQARTKGSWSSRCAASRAGARAHTAVTSPRIESGWNQHRIRDEVSASMCRSNRRRSVRSS